MLFFRFEFLFLLDNGQKELLDLHLSVPSIPIDIFFSNTRHAPLSSLVIEIGRIVQICSLAEHSLAKVVFNEVIAVAETELVKEESMKKGWPVQGAILVSEAFQVHNYL